jgi:hypothetical protein
MLRTLLIFLLLGQVGLVSAQPFEQGRFVSDDRAVLPLRDRPAAENRMLTERLETLLPGLMDETGIDMWLVIAREYAEDPVYFSLVPQPTFAARRTTMLIFNRTGDTVERLTVNRYPMGDPYESAWSGGNLDEQWQALGELIKEKNPGTIGINVSRHWPVADGLTHGLHERLVEVLPPGFEPRIKSAEELVIRWVETRSASEVAAYGHIVGLARQVIGEAFSSRVITPGVTTTDDVAWYIRQRFADLNLPAWFMPYVNLQRPGEECTDETDFCGVEGLILPGDVLHTDVGICYLKLCTDTQEMGYVARLGEEDVPESLKRALAVGNQWQDDLTDAFSAGKTGNEILAETHRRSEARDAQSSTYTHPIGFYGHAPGPVIGMWDNQDGVPIGGDWKLHPMTAYAIEGNVKVPVPEWGDQWVQIKLEQTALFDGEGVNYVAGRQTEWHVIR